MNPGVYLRMDRAEYDAIPFYNQTTLKKWMELGDVPSDFAYWRAHRLDDEDKECFLIGSAVECMLLEPTQFNARFAVAPECDRRTKVGKATWDLFKSENIGKQRLTDDQNIKVVDMFRSLRAVESLSDVFICCKKAVLIANVFGADCKGEADLWEEKTNHIWDLKAIKDVSQHGFGKAFCDFGYDIQAVFYLELARALGFNKRVFNFVCVKNSPPYSVQVHSFVPDESVKHAEIYSNALVRIEDAVKELGRRIEANDFRDDQDWRLIDIPAWRLKQAKFEMEMG